MHGFIANKIIILQKVSPLRMTNVVRRFRVAGDWFVKAFDWLAPVKT